MKPYYEHAGITIYHGDCRDLGHVGSRYAVVSDPPYGMSNDADYSRFSGGKTRRGPGTCHDDIIADDKPFDPSVYGLVGYPKIILWGANHYWNCLDRGGCLVWVKRNEEAYGSFLSDAEIAFVSGIKGVYCFHKVFAGSSKALDAGFSPYLNSAHPNQKPLALMEWCLSFVDESHKIYDPFMGSGTTLVAAKNKGRHAVGVEIEERYCEIAARRLAQEVLF